ncbi:MAG: ankyrin repeat domain-containing protein [Candidatus Eremiobacterota bacterium]
MANHPIFYPAFHGDALRVKAFIQADPTLLEVRTGAGLTPLQVAASRSQCEVARVLLDAGASVQGGPPDVTWTPLVWAAYRGHQEVVALLLEHGADPTSRGGNPIHYAAQRRHKEICRMLVQHGAIDGLLESGSQDELELFRAAFSYDTESVVRVLERRPELIRAANREGETALHVAATLGDTRTVKELLRYGADPQAKSLQGMTPLGRARQHHQQAVASILVGSQRKPRPASKRTFFRFCVVLPERGDVEGLRSVLEAHPQHADELLHGVRDGPDHGSYSVMAYSTWLCRFDGRDRTREVVAWLLSEHGFPRDLWAVLALDDMEGLGRLLKRDPELARARHPLFGHLALEIARSTQRGRLLAHGADDGSIFTAVVLGDISRATALLNAKPSLLHACRPDVDRTSLLAHALVWGQDAFACELLDRGADPDRPDINGYTPRGLAGKHGTPLFAARMGRPPR